MSESLSRLRQLYTGSHAAVRAWKGSTGGKVVGYVGADVPEEMILAAGMLPIRVSGDPWASTAAVEPHVEPVADPGVKSIAARLLDGTYDYLDHLVICVTPSIYGALYGFFMEARRLDPVFPGPVPHLFDFLHSRYRTTSLFNRRSLEVLRARLAEWSGRPVTSADLAASIREVNETRGLLARIADLRVARRLTGAEALMILGGACTAPRETFRAALKALLQSANELPVHAGIPVVYSGTETETSQVYEQIESAGVLIVADDQEWGSRVAEVLVDESLDPIDGICDRYHFRSPQSAGRPVVDRQAYVADLVRRSGAEAVIFHILAIDHPSSWDYPRLRDHLHGEGIPTTELGPRRYRDTDDTGLREAVARFAADHPRSAAAG